MPLPGIVGACYGAQQVMQFDSPQPERLSDRLKPYRQAGSQQHAERSRPTTPPLKFAPPADAGSPPPTAGTPLRGASDPRWVLAVRTGEALQGAVLRPDRREKLLRLGRLLGLTPFDCNMIIAIVQDQARRGHDPAYCPTAGQQQLEMVSPPQADLPARRRRIWFSLAILTGLIVVEWLLIKSLFLS